MRRHKPNRKSGAEACILRIYETNAKHTESSAEFLFQVIKTKAKTVLTLYLYSAFVWHFAIMARFLE